MISSILKSSLSLNFAFAKDQWSCGKAASGFERILSGVPVTRTQGKHVTDRSSYRQLHSEKSNNGILGVVFMF